jgi:putative addiction module killer protein
MNWNILYLEPVETWLDSLDTLQFKSVSKEISLLTHHGNQLRLPHSRALGDGLFELRERQYGLRIYYGFEQGAVIILLHGGDKDSQQQDIKTAKQRLTLHRTPHHEGKKF